jgi:hypothetical protein
MPGQQALRRAIGEAYRAEHCANCRQLGGERERGALCETASRGQRDEATHAVRQSWRGSRKNIQRDLQKGNYPDHRTPRVEAAGDPPPKTSENLCRSQQCLKSDKKAPNSIIKHSENAIKRSFLIPFCVDFTLENSELLPKRSAYSEW